MRANISSDHSNDRKTQVVGEKENKLKNEKNPSMLGIIDHLKTLLFFIYAYLFMQQT